MTFFPPIAWHWAVLTAAVMLIGGTLLAWRGANTLPLASRLGLTVLRALALACLALLLFNPGRWKQPEHEEIKRWAVLLDRSASMATPDAGAGTRWDLGLAQARIIEKTGGDRVRVLSFSGDLESQPDASTVPDAPESGLVRSGVSLFNGTAGVGGALAGAVIISDGRQTREEPLSDLVIRARAAGVPIHTIPLGTAWGGKDLSVRASRRQFMTFPGKPLGIGATVENRGLGKIKPRVEVRTLEGKTLAGRDLVLDSGEKQSITLDLPSVPAGDYRLVVPAWEGEDVTENNEDRFRVQVLANRTRVFLAEGAPYWDSKFLAQLLREQGFMDIRAVYRLNSERYFRVDSQSSEPMAVTDAVFPRTAEDYAKLDLVVLGKNAESFLDPEALEGLRTFVRDQGGALLLARGRACSGKLAGLEALEPVEWEGEMDGEFRFEPVTQGEAVGLFGQSLPGITDPVWHGLPALKDVGRVARMKPFSQVLAAGVKTIAGHEEKVPLLVARRFGRGVVAVVNADGLWKWDFFPEARKLGNMYEEFWTQLLQWTAGYAEFLPGQDLSLRLSESSVRLGRSVRATVGWRGGKTMPRPEIKLWKNDVLAATVACSIAGRDREDGASWSAVLEPQEAGSYRVQVVDAAGGNAKPGPETALQIRPPISEREDLSSDPAFLRKLAEDTGGRVVPIKDVAAFATDLIQTKTDDVRQAGEAEWQPLWPKGSFLSVLAGLLGAEWWLRRRRGLL